MAARRGKNQARRNSGNGTPGWVWLVIGLVLGVVLFLTIPGLLRKDGDGFARFGPSPNPDAQPAPIADADVEAVATETPAAPAKPTDASAATGPQYDFYNLLSGKEVQMSDAELAASARAEATRQVHAQPQDPATPALTTTGTTPATLPSDPVPLPETPPATAKPHTTEAPIASAGTTPASDVPTTRYILQAGAFGASGDAEATKARIAMMGLTARVESAQANGKTVYRVRMGPYGTASELAEAKQTLANGGLPAVAIKAQ